jgi:virginiamycin B lyase
MRRFALACAAAPIVAAALASPTSLPAQARAAADSAPITEWQVPWERTRPRDPFVDGKGRVWFVGQVGNYIAQLDPRSGQFKRFDITEGTNPHNLVVDAKGTVWFTGNRNGRLVSMDPETGKLGEFMLPDSTVRDPHTMVIDKAGNAWFTAQRAGAVGRRDAKTGAIRFWKTGPRSSPYGIVVDGRGHVWFDLFGTNKLGTIDPATMEMREVVLPNEASRPRRIATTSDGAIWYGDYTRGFLGRVDPATGKVDEYALPSGAASLPYAMTTDDRDRIWLAETGVKPNRLVAFDPKTRAFTVNMPVEGGDAPNTIRHMVFHAPTRTIWYGTDRNTIGRARVPAGNPVSF